MSTNRKHREEPAFLRQYTRDVLQRSIVIEDKSVAIHYNRDEGLRRITENLNKYIQSLNFMIERNIPYLSLTASQSFENAVRMIIRENAQDEDGVLIELEDLRFLDITHLIDLFICEGGFFLDYPIDSRFNVEVILNSMFTRMMIIDIFLDIAFFNSYSFLKNANNKKKREFSKKKYAYFKQHNLSSCFGSVTDSLNYYSFAFSCHKNVEKGDLIADIDNTEDFDLDLDLLKYVDIWNGFMATFFPKYIHHEKSIKEQINLHTDAKQISPNYYQELFNYPPGIYIIIRLNSISGSERQKRRLSSIFRGSKLTVGLMKVVTVDEFEQISDLVEMQVISAFKIVVTEENRLIKPLDF